MDPDVKEVLDYFKDCLDDYEKFVRNIGKLGMAAPMLFYYRDEVQECLEDLQNEKDVELKPYWARVSELDNIVRASAAELVREVGHNNFKQYQIVNDPPKMHWWWYLDKTVPAPVMPVHRPWEFWK